MERRDAVFLDQLQWFLLKTKPRNEERVLCHIKMANYHCFLPTYWKTSLWGRKREKKPLFPGYIFVHARLKRDYHKLRYTRGVTSFVKFGGCPVPVPEEVIEGLHSRMHDDGTVKMISKPLKKGDRVKISEGPLAGFEGIFLESLKDGERVALLLNGLNSMRVEINRLHVSSA